MTTILPACEHWRRARLREGAVEVFRPRPQQFKRRPVFILERSPVNKIGGSRQVHGALAPIHPVVPIDLRSDQPSLRRVELRNDAC